MTGRYQIMVYSFADDGMRTVATALTEQGAWRKAIVAMHERAGQCVWVYRGTRCLGMA
jgi:hypothetical protein